MADDRVMILTRREDGKALGRSKAKGMGIKMDERKTTANTKGRRKKPENPLLQPENSKVQRMEPGRRERASSRGTAENTGRERRGEDIQKKNVYKLRILTIILVLLIVALIAAFVSEIGIYGNQSGKTNGGASAFPAQTEQAQKTESEQAQTAGQSGAAGVEDSIAGL